MASRSRVRVIEDALWAGILTGLAAGLIAGAVLAAWWRAMGGEP